jgi:hypothetical protein
MSDKYDINENNFLARIGQIKQEEPKAKAAPAAEKEEE